VQAVLALLRKELLVPLLSAKQTDEQDTRPIHGEQCANGVELGSEDLEHNQRERELPDGGADIGALECSLCCSDLYQLRACQDY